MANDGNDIRCLSFHETNEWHPSVNNDGLIVWTRWDYVDRHGCTAHHPWVMTPDGRDPRAVHGNFSPRPSRADMELDVPSAGQGVPLGPAAHQLHGCLHVAVRFPVGVVRRGLVRDPHVLHQLREDRLIPGAADRTER
jgi:hypothetical protein